MPLEFNFFLLFLENKYKDLRERGGDFELWYKFICGCFRNLKTIFLDYEKKNCSQKQKIEGKKLVTKPSLRFLRWGKVTYKRFFLKIFWENYKRRLKEQLDSKNYKTLSWQKMKVWLLGLEHSIGTRFWKNVLSVCWGDFSQIGLLTNVMQRLYCNLCGKWVWCSYCWYWRWYLPI